MARVTDRWAAAQAYERFMGRWSRELAREYVLWLEAPAGLDWLDVGCGTGALASAICAYAEPRSVLACDPEEVFVRAARHQNVDNRVSFAVAGADDFPLRPEACGSIASLLALNFFPDAASALDRMRTGVAAGGVVSACVWDYAGGMQFLRRFWDAAARVVPDARRYDEAVRFPDCNPARLHALFHAANLQDVRSGSIEIRTEFHDFDDYWRPFLGGTGPAPTFVAALDEETRERLRRSVQASLSLDDSGHIALRARAWAVRGVRLT